MTLVKIVGHRATSRFARTSRALTSSRRETTAKCAPVSKGIGINTDGTSGSVTYEDTFVLTGQGWRISYRKVVARRVPLGGRRK
ncbi:hypothetical protein [Streptomyces sp. NBC_00582]|uniref:hypothetical protein n=1 Tax=Streptomyces sp. NBC_00582 TaxID=2975783 RepID=UPI002E818BC2|nr:hypothetical protein [Streptomyces sp. NBC_00582]WUB59395.1 hypothetical protein OG852_02755 [Streptomyces sp. NBC_00582]